MKSSRVISIVLIAFTVIAWLAFFFAPKDQEQIEFDNHTKQADKYLDRGLYQKAIEEYNLALLIKPDNEKIWTEKFHTYDLLYKENPDNEIYDAYLEDVKNAIVLFPQNPEYHLTAARLLTDDDDYKEAYKLLSRAVDAGVVNDEILDMQFKTKYAFKYDASRFFGGYDCVNSYYLLKDYSGWVYLDETGSRLAGFSTYPFAGPVGDNSVRFVSTGEKNFLIDDNKVIQGYFTKVPDEAGFYSAVGLIPLKYNKKYYYYNILGDVQFDSASYDFAGTFYNGTAAVKDNNRWYIIDSEGNKVSEEEYDDVILNQDNTYLKNGVKSLKHIGDPLYTVYVNDESIGKFENVSFVTNDCLIAVCENGKWGFIDLQGEFVIEPQYICARSFSNGLAAVYDGNAWGFIDTDGKLAIPYQFIDVGAFAESGYCLVISEQEIDEDTKEKKTYWQLIALYNRKEEATSFLGG